MKTVRQIMPLVHGLPPLEPERPPIVFTKDQWAAPKVVAARMETCTGCPSNIAGRCKECCGNGTPITVLVKLTASHCARKKWKE